MSPRIYLTMDNCFAIKRWNTPDTWMPIIKDLGINYIEASTDNEIDPLFTTPEYRKDWVNSVKRLEKELKMKVAAFYTGYQTYRTTGIAHHDPRIVEKLKNEWFSPLIDMASELDTDRIGFSFHALTHNDLQNEESYKSRMNQIIENYSDLAEMSNKKNVLLCSEQMYAPHQHSWRINENIDFLKGIKEKNGSNFYTSVDVGHQIGQWKFNKPSRTDLLSNIDKCERGLNIPEDFWFGIEEARLSFQKSINDRINRDRYIEETIEIMDSTPWMFSEEIDSDPYAWLSNLGAFSPIMHLHQNDGRSASHAPFIKENNSKGIVDGGKVLKSIWESYNKEIDGMPEKVDKIYLSFEVFLSNTAFPARGLRDLKESVEYWRKFIPEDGMELEEIINSVLLQTV